MRLFDAPGDSIIFNKGTASHFSRSLSCDGQIALPEAQWLCRRWRPNSGPCSLLSQASNGFVEIAVASAEGAIGRRLGRPWRDATRND